MSTTYMAKNGEVKPNWHIIDADGKVLGRLASEIAILLQGKHKPTYTPHADTGDFVVVLNVGKLRVTGKKADVLEYDTYSRYPGGRKLYSFETMKEKHPERLLELAVKRMLPKNKLGRKQLTHLKSYTGTEHPHAAQQPKARQSA